MDKRSFLKASGTIALGGLVIACGPKGKVEPIGKNDTAETARRDGDFTLPELPYSYGSLAPNIDARTMEIHHSKHHAGYVRKLNNAVKDTKYSDYTLAQILTDVDGDPENDAVRNNAGGHFNHSLFWEIMSPNQTNPDQTISDKITRDLGSLESFENEFSTAAKTVFGSGWAWLCVDSDTKLFVTTSENQNNPLMKNITEKNGRPILGIDVWEHAYYLKYQNKRGEYISNFMKVINWNKVSENYKNILAI